MGIISYTEKERDLLARLMRAEALGEGEMGMLMVGNVGVNRVLSTCLTFKNITTITQMIYQNPGGFSGTESPLFFAAPTENEKRLADLVLSGKNYFPATNALWFYAPKKGEECLPFWWDQKNIGRYKNHCFYEPYPGICPEIH
ncbi:MAG: cell wall hydrolase [Bacilli bacterium]|nr:cell wall hydrolase [Bacilli bacterium]